MTARWGIGSPGSIDPGSLDNDSARGIVLASALR